MQFSLDNILKDLHKISGLRISIFDISQNLITGYPEGPSDFCGFVRRNLPSNGYACLNQDLCAFQKAQQTGDTYIYQCHMGLLEAIAPLYYHGIPAGYLMVGQALEDIPSGKSRVITSASKITGDLDYLEGLLAPLPVMSRGDMEAFAHIIRICAEYITLHHDFTISSKNLAQEILFYLNMHYAEKITMAELCQRFYSSKTKLNKVFHTCYQISIFDKLTEIRLHESCMLLKTTQLPVHMVARQCGIPDANYFSRTFRKVFHCSPTQYREREAGENSTEDKSRGRV